MIRKNFNQRVEKLVAIIMNRDFGGTFKGRGPARGYSAMSRHVGKSRTWLSCSLTNGKHYNVVRHLSKTMPEFRDPELLRMADKLFHETARRGKQRQEDWYEQMRGDRHKAITASNSEKWKLSVLVATYPSPYPGKPLEGLC